MRREAIRQQSVPRCARIYPLLAVQTAFILFYDVSTSMLMLTLICPQDPLMEATETRIHVSLLFELSVPKKYASVFVFVFHFLGLNADGLHL